jgi:hypothetical protein
MVEVRRYFIVNNGEAKRAVGGGANRMRRCRERTCGAKTGNEFTARM